MSMTFGLSSTLSSIRPERSAESFGSDLKAELLTSRAHGRGQTEGLTRIDHARLEQRLVLSPVNSVIYC